MSKRIGRPTKSAAPRSRVSLGLKVTADVKTKIDRAAQESGRSQSQEAEMRLERTFRDDEVLSVLQEIHALLSVFGINEDGSLRPPENYQNALIRAFEDRKLSRVEIKDGRGD